MTTVESKDISAGEKPKCKSREWDKKKKRTKKKKDVVLTGTLFQTWCLSYGITQRHIVKKTNLSYGTIHNIWNDGKASASVITLIEAKLSEILKSATQDAFLKYKGTDGYESLAKLSDDEIREKANESAADIPLLTEEELKKQIETIVTF